MTDIGGEFTPAGHVIDEKAIVNGLVGLMATGGSTNLTIHMAAIIYLAQRRLSAVFTPMVVRM